MLSPRAGQGGEQACKTKPVESGGSQGRVPQLSPLLSMACHGCWCWVTDWAPNQVGMWKVGRRWWWAIVGLGAQLVAVLVTDLCPVPSFTILHAITLHSPSSTALPPHTPYLHAGSDNGIHSPCPRKPCSTHPVNLNPAPVTLAT